MLKIDRRLLNHFDWLFLALTLTIPLVGLVVLYSAGYDPDSSVEAFKWLDINFRSVACFKQAGYLLVGLCVMGVGMSIPTQIFHRYAFVLYGAALALLGLVAGFGVVVLSCNRPSL